ncbi:MAG: hypothetical protein KJO29_06970 [Bacteroidia bacterium]|nr:hypothetical protein [Bacteroidia bacterium]
MINSIIVLFSISIIINTNTPDWGFFGHRKINRYAVFTLPEDMLGFYKKHIEFLTAHAVDPDKRRYALKTEATRHYIDIDAWDTMPFNKVPREFEEAVFKYGSFIFLDRNKDTFELKQAEQELRISPEIRDFIMDDRYSNEVHLPLELSCPDKLDEQVSAVIFRNRLAENGVLPFFLEEFYNRLVRSFDSNNAKAILKISADIGHYIADAHVPLHTTLNYNGELTDQKGIHAFWESRLPELFAEKEYDFMVGKAEYISDLRSYIWTTITESHACLESVLQNEMNLREQYPRDQQICYDERNDVTGPVQCRAFSKAYHDSMDGMVERRMRKSIHAVGSIWYSAWIDAGQPEMDKLSHNRAEEKNINKVSNLINETHHQ